MARARDNVILCYAICNTFIFYNYDYCRWRRKSIGETVRVVVKLVRQIWRRRWRRTITPAPNIVLGRGVAQRRMLRPGDILVDQPDWSCVPNWPPRRRRDVTAARYVRPVARWKCRARGRRLAQKSPGMEGAAAQKKQYRYPGRAIIKTQCEPVFGISRLIANHNDTIAVKSPWNSLRLVLYYIVLYTHRTYNTGRV